jgi:6-pyruvoyltetrahydropterin/6-carboxytetrahydropterin synthase
MTDPTFEIVKGVNFDAAHFMPWEAQGQPYRRMHGHSFRLEIAVRGRRDPVKGWVEDLGAVDAALRTLASVLDHGVLNEVEGLDNPTLENICAWAAGRLRVQFPGLVRVTVSRPTLGESCTLQLDSTA